MTATKPDWRVALNKGDTVRVSTTYDTRNASWYEVMGIMETWYAEGHLPGAVDPFTTPVDWHGIVTHGHLPENDNHGGTGAPVLPNATRMLATVNRASTVDIKDFIYGQGDLSLVASGRRSRPSAAGTRSPSATSTRRPAATRTWPSTTRSPRAKAPCNKGTGIAYPVANGPVTFDSGELGYGPNGATAAAQPRDVEDAEEPGDRHLHVLLPDPPVHARVVPGGPITGPGLDELHITDPPERWKALGVAVGDDGVAQVGTIRLRFGAAQPAWRVRGLADGDLDGLTTLGSDAPAREPAPASAHPLGAVGVDHLVVASPDLDRTFAALERAGLERRRVREAGPNARQGFYVVGDGRPRGRGTGRAGRRRPRLVLGPRARGRGPRIVPPSASGHCSAARATPSSRAAGSPPCAVRPASARRSR